MNISLLKIQEAYVTLHIRFLTSDLDLQNELKSFSPKIKEQPSLNNFKFKFWDKKRSIN